MSDHRMVFQTVVDASQSEVMTALTTPEGIASWWTASVEIEADALRPSFPSAPLRFDVTISESGPRRLVWTAGEFPPPWQGTRCVWELSDGPEGGTQIDFSHRDWTDNNPMMGMVTMEWARILDHLARYVETGTPDPRTPAGAYEEN